MDIISSDIGLGSRFSMDIKGTGALEKAAAEGSPDALKEAANQFESMFLQKMLQSMRDASFKSDLLKSEQGDFYEDMLDQQWSQHLAGKGLGLAEQLISQLSATGSADATETAKAINQYLDTAENQVKDS